MPIYDYKCSQCGIKTDIWAGIDEQVISCDCGLMAYRVLSPTRGNCDMEPHFDENLGEGIWVKSRQHRKEEMKRLGLVDKWSGC
jgi:putative FmdB family regulatory protein